MSFTKNRDNAQFSGSRFVDCVRIQGRPLSRGRTDPEQPDAVRILLIFNLQEAPKIMQNVLICADACILPGFAV